MFATRLMPSLKVAAPKFIRSPRGQVHQSKIGEDLLAVDRRRPLDRLELDQQRALDQKVGSKALVKADALQPDPNRRLPLNPQASPGKVAGKHSLVDGFEKPGPRARCTVNPQSTAIVASRSISTGMAP